LNSIIEVIKTDFPKLSTEKLNVRMYR